MEIIEDEREVTWDKENKKLILKTKGNFNWDAEESLNNYFHVLNTKINLLSQNYSELRKIEDSINRYKNGLKQLESVKRQYEELKPHYKSMLGCVNKDLRGEFKEKLKNAKVNVKSLSQDLPRQRDRVKELVDGL